MANNPFFTDAVVQASVDSFCSTFLNNGYLKFYTASQAADANTAVGAQTIVSTLRFGATAFPASVASGSAGSKIVTATANAITSDTNAAGGTATWFRVLKSDNSTVVFDGSVGTSGCDINLNSNVISAGATVALSSFTVTQSE